MALQRRAHHPPCRMIPAAMNPSAGNDPKRQIHEIEKYSQVPPVGLDEPIDPMTFREAHVTRDILRGNWIHLNLRVWVRRWKKKSVETKKSEI